MIKGIIKRNIVIHPFLFAVFPVLFLFAHNVTQVSFAEVLLPLAIVLVLAVLLILFFKLVFGSYEKAGIIVSIFMVLSFSHGHILNVIQEWRIGNFVFGKDLSHNFQHLFLLAVWAFFLGFSAFIIARVRRNLNGFTSYLNLVATILVVISLINISFYKLNTGALVQGKTGRENVKLNEMDEINTTGLRDIYYIIIDRYASADTLKKSYGYDNHEFYEYLSNKGFYIASQSISNYPYTGPSLASSLNMEYLSPEAAGNLMELYAMLQDYKAWRFLKSRGYKFIHFGSGWHPSSKNKYADVNFNYYFPNEFTMFLYENSIFYPMGARVFNFDRRLQKHKRILFEFDKLDEMPNIKEPTFVFVHMLIPHHPYVFDRNGNFVTRTEEIGKERKEGYLDQLIFTNKKISALIDRLLSDSEIPPIIILQADEGPYPLSQKLDKNFSWGKVTDMELAEKMRILNAYYLPGADKNVLYPSISPVNSFRVVFNLYFNTHLDLLPDEYYLHTAGEFINITDRVR